jgi:hypothetical protein
MSDNLKKTMNIIDLTSPLTNDSDMIALATLSSRCNNIRINESIQDHIIAYKGEITLECLTAMNGPTDRYQPYLNFVQTDTEAKVFEHQGPSTRAIFTSIHTPYSI